MPFAAGQFRPLSIKLALTSLAQVTLARVLPSSRRAVHNAILLVLVSPTRLDLTCMGKNDSTSLEAAC